jgi:hypothetical protein
VGAVPKKCDSAASSCPDRIALGSALKLTMTADLFAAASPVVQAVETGEVECERAERDRRHHGDDPDAGRGLDFP